MNCQECGFEAPAGSHFCGRCGSAIEEAAPVLAATRTGEGSAPTVRQASPAATIRQHVPDARAKLDVATGTRPTARMQDGRPRQDNLADTAVGHWVPTCHECGTVLQAGAQFCNGCGLLQGSAVAEAEPLDAAVAVPLPRGWGRLPRRWAIFGGAALLIAAALTGGMCAMGVFSGGGSGAAPESTPTPGAIGGAGSGKTATPTQAATPTSAGGETAVVPATAVPPTPLPPTPIPPTAVPATPIPPTVAPTSTPVIPTPTPTPITYYFAANIDSTVYYVGDTGSLCYLMDPENIPYTVVVTQTAPYVLELGRWNDDGVNGGDCETFPVVDDDRPGFTLVVQAYIDGVTLTVTLSASVY